jgi:phenylalanyl-tRNA synthetase alpha chain
MLIKIETNTETELKKKLEERKDAEAERIKRYLSMPDLSRTPGSPLYEITERIKAAPAFKDFDVIEIPEIVPASISFDLFDFPADHPARSKSDTYYVDDENILRTHNTVSWYYYFTHPDVQERIAKGESMGVLCSGKVFRKDEIDSRHMNIFHQIDGWFMAPESSDLGPEDLKKALGEIVKTVFGPDQVFRINPDNFPYTDPSYEVEVNVKGTAAEGPAKGEWLEILGSGMIKPSVFEKMGVKGYKAWAFGFGIERLAIISMSLPDIRLLWSEDPRVKSQLKLGTVYKEVSKFPPVVRDISFVVPKSFIPNDYFDLIREVGGEMVENVALIDKYENDTKFGNDKMSYTYRVTYRHLERTLTNEEVNAIHAELENRTEQEFSASVRRV